MIRDAKSTVCAKIPHVPDSPHRFRLAFISRKAVIRLAVAAIVLVILAPIGWWLMIRMPGESYAGPLPPLTPGQAALRDELKQHVETLAGEIGERNVVLYTGLVAAVEYLETALADLGYEVERQEYTVAGKTCVNLAAEIPGTDLPEKIIVVGAHYDSVIHCPGANDNGTGVAATLALARALKGSTPRRTVRFVLFVNEEPPYFQRAEMGSRVYAKACRERGENITAMFSLETIGYYSDEPGSQHYPPPLGLVYPSTGNFIAFVGNYGSRDLVRQAIGSFRRHAQFPSEGGAPPGFIPGIGWSDHWAFWKEGYDGVMVTDTAPFRYPHYHRDTDTPDRIDYERTARVVDGLEAVIAELAGAE
jgi:Zn-dependent M28 family amino/carboxypeptidase